MSRRAPDGVTQAPNFEDLEITDSTAGSGFKATLNDIGADVGATAAGTAACDGGCNVFASRPIPGTVNIDLNGEGLIGEEAPATGPTFIHGNYIGLDASGAEVVTPGSGETGIRVGGADDVHVGDTGEGNKNYITGASYGVMAGKEADNLLITNNAIGLNGEQNGTLEPPATAGISDSSEGVTVENAAAITENRLFMGAGSVGIEQHGIGAHISGNLVVGATTGVRLWGESGSGSTVDENVIESSFGNGVLIENDNNLLLGNQIVGSKAAGIRIQDFLILASTGNTIGDDLEEDENTISESQGDAIEVAGDEDDETLIARNNGAENSGLFIDLGADGPGNQAEGPNGGIQAPAISSATPSAAGGSALPGAEVRVFLKATADAGEIQGFLGEATADGGGNWTLSYGLPIPLGTQIGATQTGLLGTSELAIATTAAPPKEEAGGGGGGGGKGGGGGGKGGGKGGSKDKTAPQTTIVGGPRKRSHRRRAKFIFTSSEAGSTFRCKLDRRPVRPCGSPKKYRKLKPGKHVFEVSAIDSAGNRDRTPATRRFRVLG